MKTPPKLIIASLPVLIAMAFSAVAITADVEAEALPLHTTWEQAMDSLEEQLAEHARGSGATIDSMKPLEPLIPKGFVAVGVRANLSGSAKQITKFLAGLSAQPFVAMPAVTTTVDRRDPSIVRAAITVHQWYAAKQKTASKIKKWRKTAKISRPAVEILEICNATLPDDGAAITSFSVNGNTVTLIGQTSSTTVGRSFGAKLFANEKLNDHKWVWLQRPTDDPRRKDGSATFRIQGKKPEKKEATTDASS